MSLVTAAGAADAELELPEDLEALRWLSSMAHKRFGAVPDEAVARHVLRVTVDGDWPLQRAAMEALVRRAGFGKRDELRVARRPPGRTQLGSRRAALRAATRIACLAGGVVFRGLWAADPASHARACEATDQKPLPSSSHVLSCVFGD